jgi:hypothetical protein
MDQIRGSAQTAQLHRGPGQDRDQRTGGDDVDGGLKLLITEAALDKLQALCDRLGKPLILRSALPQSRAQPRRRRGEGVEATGGDRF